MRKRTRAILVIAGIAGLVAAGAVAMATVLGGGNAGCHPVAGEQLVVLRDEKGLQVADNLIAVVNEKAATPELLAALDAVSAALNTDKLIGLNRAVDIDRQTSQQAAADFATAANLTAGIVEGQGGKVVISTADDTEGMIIGELYRIAVAAAGFAPEVRNDSDLERTQLALERGGVHVAPAYVGRLTEFLNAKMHGANPKPLASSDLTTTVHNLRNMGRESGLVFSKPSEAANQKAFVVTKDFAASYGVSTLSELADKCGGADTLLGGVPDCPKQPFCEPGLRQTYGSSFGAFTPLDAGGPRTKKALRTGKISVGVVSSSDSELVRN